MHRAILVRGDNSKQEWGKGFRDDSEPSVTVRTECTPRAWVESGRVVSMTTAALARFQMGVFADRYPLPASRKLASTVIGNGVPPELARAIVLPLLEAIR